MINPTTDAISEFPNPTPPGVDALLGEIKAGPDGNLWFNLIEQSETSGSFTATMIGEINPTTHAISEFPIPYDAEIASGGITVGPDGNLWFAEPYAYPIIGGVSTGGDSFANLGTINPITDAITLYTVPYRPAAGTAIGVGPGITAGPDGNIWYTDEESGGIGVDVINTFAVTQPPPASLTAGSPFGLTVEAQLASGKLDSSFNGTVTVALASDPGGATLGGTLTATASGGIATFSGLTLNTAAAGYTLTVSGNGVDDATTSAITVTPAAASQLVIGTQPSSAATAGQAFGVQPVIDVEDQYGNVEIGNNSTAVTASLASGTVPLQGTTTITVSGGVATFTNLAENKVGTISLDFTGAGLMEGPSSSIVVSPAAASQLVVHTQPSPTATAGQAFATQPVVYEEDPYGNLETSDNSTVLTASLASGAGLLYGSLATVSGGVATFRSLADNKAETISLDFRSGSLTNATSTNIVVSPATASQLVIQTQPSAAAMAGQAFATQPVLKEQDPYGNLETGDNSTVVTAALASGTGPLQGTATVAVSGGVATFAGLTDDAAGSITLRFTGGGLTSLPTTSIVVSPATASRLVIAQEPSATATAGRAFATQPVIKEEDSFGNIETGDNSTTITASPAGGSGPLLGSTVTVNGGLATFNNLADDAAETITLTFAGLGLTAGPSSSIAISPAKASQLVIHTQPSATATAGQALAIQPVVYEEDPFDNLETGDNSTVITATLTGGAGLLQGTTATVTAGVATFTNLDDETAETAKLTFAGGGLKSLPSSSITVGPAAASKVVFGQQPTSTASGAAITPAVTVEVEDAFNNVVSGDSSSVTLTLSSGTFEGGSSTVATAASSGVATFSSLKIDVPGSYTLSATDGVLTPAGVSNSFTVSLPTPTRLVIHAEPPSTATAGQAFGAQVVVYEEDQFGDLETGDNSTVVTATLASGTGPLQGTTSVTVSGGVATFTNLVDNKAETISLNFRTGSLSSAPTSSIAVTAPAPTIRLEQVVTAQKTNKKGKAMGKPVFVGFALDYSTAMDPSTAALAANYQVDSAVTKRGKKKKTTVLQPVNFTAAYNQLSNSVTLTVEGKPTFATGGQIKVIASPPNGVSSAAGVLLDGSDTVFTILPKAKGITPG
jgi:hypothetical protein